MESRLAIDLAHALVPLKGSVRDDEALFGIIGVCIDGDWPDAYRINRYVRGASDDASASVLHVRVDRSRSNVSR